MPVHRYVCRFAGPVLLPIAILAAGCGRGEGTAPPAANAPAVLAPRDLSGVWWNGETPPAMEVVGQAPELTPAGQARFAETSAETKAIAATTDKTDMRRCISFGVPRIWSQPFPIKIIQTPSQIALVYEHNHTYRLIAMDAALPSADDVDFNFMGHSVGHWDGNTLVIESGLFKDGTVLDDTGLPHGERLKVTERLRKLEGGQLEVEATVEDPDYYVRPWTVRVAYAPRPDVRLMEYVCGFGVFETRYAPSAP